LSQLLLYDLTHCVWRRHKKGGLIEKIAEWSEAERSNFNLDNPCTSWQPMPPNFCRGWAYQQIAFKQREVGCAAKSGETSSAKIKKSNWKGRKKAGGEVRQKLGGLLGDVL